MRTESDEMPSTSGNEGRYVEMSQTQGAVSNNELCDEEAEEAEEECIMYWSQAEPAQSEDTGKTSIISAVKLEMEECMQSVCSNDNSDTLYLHLLTASMIFLSPYILVDHHYCLMYSYLTALFYILNNVFFRYC